MSILDSIKEERKLSFNHWRYRILHWAFNTDPPNPKNLDLICNGIPKFLYTHYCPLFHLTNLIALLSPLILFFKVVWVVLCALYACLDLIPWGSIKAFFAGFFPPPKAKKVHSKPELTAEMERRICIKYICEWHSDLESFLACYCFTLLSKEDVINTYNEYMHKVLRAREEAELRKKKWRETIIFWTNFSQVFIKWALNLVYLGLAAILLGLVYLIAYPVFSFICWVPGFVLWLFEDGVSWVIVWMTVKLLFWSTIVMGVISVLVRTGIAGKFFANVFHGLKYIMPPTYIVTVPFNWIVQSGVNAIEFIAMFYEENCPPVTIISEEEAAVESVARNGEEV
jgi:hypothetical protein